MVWSWVRRRTWAVAVGAATSLTSAAANATVVVPYRLVYEAPQECPNERALRNAIAERIGREPFMADEPKTLSVRIERVGRGFRATIATTNSEGSSRTRTLESPVNRCADIFKDVDFVVGTIVEPILIDLPAPEEQPNVPAAPAPPPAPPPTPATTPFRPTAPPQRQPYVNGEVYGGVALSVFGTPGPLSLGGLVGGGLKARMWSSHAEVQGLTDIPGATTAIPVGVSLWSGKVDACVSREFFFCATFAVGAHHFSEYQGIRPVQRRTLFASPGLRLGYDSPTWRGIFGRAQIDLSIPLTETTVRDLGLVVWASAPVIVSGALLIGKRF